MLIENTNEHWAMQALAMAEESEAHFHIPMANNRHPPPFVQYQLLGGSYY
jgi:hypothetical protein